MEFIWPLLPNGGLLVVSAVVANTRQVLKDFAASLSSDELSEMESVEVSVKRGQLTNTGLDYTTKLPVEVFKFTKTAEIQNQNMDSESTINKSGSSK